MIYVRFESATADPQGSRTGVFGLTNGLARSGKLSAKEWTWWRQNNDWFDAAYPDPSVLDPSLFDATVNPGATCWFKETAQHLLERVPGYLELLDRHDIRWTELRSADPGLILYEDAVQVVVLRKGNHQADRRGGRAGLSGLSYPNEVS